MKYLKLSLLIVLLTTLSIIISLAQDGTPSAPSDNVVTVSEALLRSGPSTNYVAVGSLAENSILSPVNINEDGSWVLVEYRGGYGWIRRDLASWGTAIDDLPVIYPHALTPTTAPTEASTPFPFATATPAGDYVLTTAVNVLVRSGPGRDFPRIGRLHPGTVVEPVSIDESGDWVLIHYTDRIATAVGFGVTLAPSFDGFAWVSRPLVAWTTNLSTLPVMYRDNLTPSPTPNITHTLTHTPTSTSTPSATYTAVPTETATYTATNTAVPTETATHTATNTDEPTETATEENVVALVVTAEPSPTLTATPEPSATVEASPTFEPTATDEPTQQPVTELQSEIVPPVEPSDRLPIELIIGGIVIVLAIVYILLYIRGQSTVDRYINGAPLKECPVCGGALTVDTRIERSLGIPNAKHLIRCNKCRSILRELEARQWRYAVDRSANPQLYLAYNNRTLSERELVNIQSTPLPSGKPVQKPQFSDEDVSHDLD